MFWNDKELDFYYKKLPPHIQECMNIASKYCVSIKLIKGPNDYFQFEGYATHNDIIEVFAVSSAYTQATKLPVTIWHPRNGWHWGTKSIEGFEKFMKENIKNKKKFYMNKKLSKIREDF